VTENATFDYIFFFYIRFTFNFVVTTIGLSILNTGMTSSNPYLIRLSLCRKMVATCSTKYWSRRKHATETRYQFSN